MDVSANAAFMEQASILMAHGGGKDSILMMVREQQDTLTRLRQENVFIHDRLSLYEAGNAKIKSSLESLSSLKDVLESDDLHRKLQSLPVASTATNQDRKLDKYDDLLAMAEETAVLVKETAKKLACVSKTSNKENFVLEGCNVFVVNGEDHTETTNGLGNLIIGYNGITPDPFDGSVRCGTKSGTGCQRSGSHNLVIGDDHEYLSYGGIVTGNENTITDKYATVIGAFFSWASAPFSGIFGGTIIEASGEYSVTIGGSGNKATGYASVASGGANSVAAGKLSVVSGGKENTASGEASTVSAGSSNLASGASSTVSGGANNIAAGESSLVAGGDSNTATGTFSAVNGGKANTASGYISSVTGGSDNSAAEAFSSVSGGSGNVANANFTSIAGGSGNTATGLHSSILGGKGTTSLGEFSTILGGDGTTGLNVPFDIAP